MWRPNIKNRSFDRMGERYSRVIDPDHFLGRSAFDIPWEKDENPPAVNIREEGELIRLDLAVPGFRKEELSITLRNGLLTVRGEHEEETPVGSNLLREEFSTRSFKRSFRLASEIAREKITAHYENGILTLMIFDVPQSEERAYRKVTVEG